MNGGDGMGKPKRVAVIGASGIGRHHANWWTVEGAEVCAFLGRTPESTAATRARLADMFGFDGNAYTDLDEMLAAESPDIVDVCSPAGLHYGHAKVALQAGCHVLCEKPLVYDPGLSHDVVLSQARELVDLARNRGLLFGMATQYFAAGDICLGLFRRWSDDAVSSVVTELRSPAKGRAPDPRPIWVDLAPHLVAVVQAVVPDGVPAWDTCEIDFDGYNAFCRLLFRRADGTSVSCELRAGRTVEGEPDHSRVIELNGARFDLQGDRDGDGHFCFKAVTDRGDFHEPDTMRLLIRQFLAGETPLSPERAVENLALILHVLELAG